MHPNENEKANSGRVCAAAAIDQCFAGAEDNPQQVAHILSQIEPSAKELFAPHQKRLGIFDLDNYVLNQIAGAVLAAHGKVNAKTRGEKKLTPEDIGLVLCELKTEWEKK